jgi:P-type Mg2+ transporter
MKLSRILAWLGLIALIVAVLVNFGIINDFVQLLGDAKWYVLVLVPLVQLASYLSVARYYQTVLAVFGYKVELKRLFDVALGINFVNQVFPSGGLSGASFLSRSLKGEVPAGKATLAQVMRYIFTYLSFVAVLVLGFLMLFLGNEVNKVTVRVTLLIILVILIGSILLMALISDRVRLERVGDAFAGFVNWLTRLVSRRHRKAITPEQRQHFFNEFYNGYELLMSDKRSWMKPLFFTFTTSMAEVATVYVVVLGFSTVVNPGVVIGAYAIANCFSLLSFFSGGVGFFEASMVAALAALGMPLALALSVTVVYRGLNFIFMLPPGYLIYRKEV